MVLKDIQMHLFRNCVFPVNQTLGIAQDTRLNFPPMKEKFLPALSQYKVMTSHIRKRFP